MQASKVPACLVPNLSQKTHTVLYHIVFKLCMSLRKVSPCVSVSKNGPKMDEANGLIETIIILIETIFFIDYTEQ